MANIVGDAPKTRGLTRLTEEQKATVEANIGLVHAIALKVRVGLSRDDRVQAGTLGLMRAVQLYDPSLGYKLSTYSRQHIINAIHKADARERPIHVPAYVTQRRGDKAAGAEKYRPCAEAVGGVVSLDQWEGDETTAGGRGPEAPIVAAEEAAYVRLAVRRLPDRERSVVTSRVWRGETVKQAGARIGVHTDTASRLASRAFAQLREILGPDYQHARGV